MDSFWHYIRSSERDDRIRNMKPKALKRFASELTMAHVPNFRAIIMDSNWQKIKQHPAVAEAMKESTLPFEFYYVTREGLRIRPNYFKWFLWGMEEIRLALKEGREPDFSRIKDHREGGIYDHVMPRVQKQQAAPVVPTEGKLTQAPVPENVSNQETQETRAEPTGHSRGNIPGLVVIDELAFTDAKSIPAETPAQTSDVTAEQSQQTAEPAAIVQNDESAQV
jgi:hypothetical protein